MYKTIDI